MEGERGVIFWVLGACLVFLAELTMLVAWLLP
jgi:hypothetical protein